MCWKWPGLSTISAAKQRLNLLITAALPSSPRRASLYPRLTLGRRQQHLNICAAGRPLEAAVISSSSYTGLDHNQLQHPISKKVYGNLPPVAKLVYVCNTPTKSISKKISNCTLAIVAANT